jgi:PadR family transcriptional regulator PadR
MNVQFKKGVLDLCVLAMLNDSDRYGYELASTLSEIIMISDGTVYPLLRKLASDGLVASYLQESQSGPPRNYYSLTAMGKIRLAELLEDWNNFTASVNKIVGGKSV